MELPPPPPPPALATTLAGALAATRRDDGPESAHLHQPLLAPPYLAPDPEAAARTIKWVWEHKRCGVYLRVDGSRVVAWQPFANPSYRNRYTGATGPPLPQGAIPDPTRWWFNGATVCNIQPARGPIWGSAQLPELLQIIEEGLAAGPAGSICFEAIVNKRDGAYLHKATRHPDLEYKPTGPIVPILSQYGGPSCWDVMMPCSALVGVRHLVGTAPPPWEDRRPMAVFRGSATGAGITPATNQRLDLAGRRDALLKAGLADVGITSVGQRARVAGVTAAGVLEIGRVDPSTPTVPRMSMEDQARGFRYAIYVEGHSAALRYLELMLRGFAIIKVAPSRMCAAHDLWFFGELVPGADHVAVKTVADVEPAIRELQADDARAAALATAARAAAIRIVNDAPGYMYKLMRTMTLVQSGEYARSCASKDMKWLLH